MKVQRVRFPRWWWIPFLGAAAMLLVGGISGVALWSGQMVSEADRLVLSVERGEATMQQLDAAIAAHPDYGLAFELRARLRAEAGDWEGALLDIERAVGLSPESPELLQLRAEIRRARAAAAAAEAADAGGAAPSVP